MIDTIHHAYRGAVSVAMSRRPRFRRCGGWRGSTSTRSGSSACCSIPKASVLLNDTGAAILDLCDGQRSSPTSPAILQERYQCDVTADVIEYLSAARREGVDP